MTVVEINEPNLSETWWKCDYAGCEARAQSGTTDTSNWRVVVSGYSSDRQHRHYCPIHRTDAAIVNALDPVRYTKPTVTTWKRISVVEMGNMRVIIEQLSED
jgi:hypothetical protein